MSNTQRKARKRRDYDFTHNPDGSLRPVRARIRRKLSATYWFDRRHKEGTPFAERAENRARPIFGKGKDNPPTRVGITSRTASAFMARDLTVDDVLTS